MGFLKGKTAIITGAGRAVLSDGGCGSIGYGIATAYAKEGANLVITGRNVKNSISGTSEPTAPDAFAFVSVSCIIMFGGVPMRVIIPPMLLAKARGMRSLLEEVPAYAAMLTTIGSIRATVPVLLTKAPMNAVTSITRRNSLVSLVPASFIT